MPLEPTEQEQTALQVAAVLVAAAVWLLRLVALAAVVAVVFFRAAVERGLVRVVRVAPQVTLVEAVAEMQTAAVAVGEQMAERQHNQAI